MSDYLPVDVLVEILSRLPVKSLLKFTCVCKQWYSIILSPNFISKHLNESLSSSTNEDQLVLVRNYNMFSETERFALHFDNELFNEQKELECPFSRVNDYFRIVGSCNGLICLADDYDTHTDTIIIWNPSVRKSVTLPKPLFTSPPQGAHLLGFGFDALHNDYKVVRIVYHLNIPGDHHYSIPPKVEIYTLSTGLWRNICDAAPMYDIFNYFPSPAFLNGSVHWVGSKRGDDCSFHNLISAVDMSTEVFKEIMMPNSLAETEVLKLAISTLGTSLALIQYEKIWQSEYCWVWVMKEYGMAESWTRLFKIDMRDGIRKVVGFQKTNEVLLSARVRGLISYHPNIQQIEYLGIHGTNRSLYVDSFVESLVLLKGGNRGLQLENYRDAVIGEIERLVLGEGSN